jgi:hypothetical protein
MNIVMPFLRRKASVVATPPPAAAAPVPRSTASAKIGARRFRPFVKPAPTTFQRVLAAHMYSAERRSALA